MVLARLRFGILSLFFGLFFFPSCSDFFSPVRDHLEEYSTMVIVLGHEVLTDWAPDRSGITNVPSAIPANIRFSLQNPRNYDLIPSLRFTDPAVESSLPGNAYTLALSPDRQFVDIQLSSEFLAMHERGGNISFELTLTERQTQRVFPSCQLALRANTAPPGPAGARVMVDNSTNNYVVCFNLDLSDPLQDDLAHITVNNSVYTVSSITTGGTPDITFTEPGISTTEPTMGTSIVSGLDGFIVDSGMTQIYVTTVIPYVPTEYHSFTIQVTDTGGITRQRTTTTGAPLDPVEFSAGGLPIPAGGVQDLTPNTVGNASLVMVSPNPGATMHYQIVSNGIPSAPQTSIASSHTITLPEGSHVISAYATQYGYSESVEVSVTIHVIDPARIYVHNIDGDDANRGTLGSPCRRISDAYSKLPNKNDAANTIVLLSDIREVDANGALASLRIDGNTHLTIDGQGHMIDATPAPTYLRGMYVFTNTSPAPSLELTLQDLTICNAIYGDVGAGLYVWYMDANVVLENCIIDNNVSYSQAGGGVYFRGTSLTLHGTTVTGNGLEGSGSMDGGGIYAGYCTFTADQGTIIQDNHITAAAPGGTGRGAGLCLDVCSTVNFDDATISDNYMNGDALGTAEGAGVYVNNSWGGTSNFGTVSITGNWIEITNVINSGGHGGGIYYGGDSITVKDNSIISNNTLSATVANTDLEGAGFSFYGNPVVTVIMSNVNIDGNRIEGSGAQSASGAGGYLENAFSIDTFTNVHVNTNTISITGAGTEGYGAGLYLAGGSYNFISPCFIHGNSIASNDSYGAGIYLSSGSVTLNGTEITDNSGTAANVGCGGGLYMGDNTTVSMNGGRITGNSANTGSTGVADSKGDGVYMRQSGNGATFTLNSGEISGNQSNGNTNTAFYLEDSGVSLYLGNDAVISGSNVVYFNNQATIDTSGILSAPQVATLQFRSYNSNQVLLGNPAANHYKFNVLPIGGAPYQINSAGYLTPGP